MAVYYPRAKVVINALFDGFGSPDETEYMSDILPSSFNVHLNSYKEADTFEVTIDALQFPFAPELLRSAEVSIYAYEAEDGTDNPDWQKPENLLIVGLVDDATLTQAEDGGTISLTGRDYTCLLLDVDWRPTDDKRTGQKASGSNGRIPANLPLDKCVQQLVDEATNADEVGRTLIVELRDADVNPTTGRVAATATKKKVTTKTGGGRSSKKKRGIPVKADQKYWDVIYKLCMSYGYIVYVQGLQVIITRPHVQQAEALGAAHRVAYGRNLTSLSNTRKLSREAVPQICVRSSSDKDGKIREARFPEKKDVVRTGIGTKKDEFKVFTVGDVYDVAQLKEIARTTYYTLARGEGSISFTTAHLRDLPAPRTPDDALNRIADPSYVGPEGSVRSMLTLRPGLPVVIAWDAFNFQIMNNQGIGEEQKISYIMSLGYTYTVAKLVARQYAQLEFFRGPFYCKEVNITWDADNGLEFDVTAVNFINIKRDAVVEG